MGGYGRVKFWHTPDTIRVLQVTQELMVDVQVPCKPTDKGTRTHPTPCIIHKLSKSMSKGTEMEAHQQENNCTVKGADEHCGMIVTVVYRFA